jgi:hypothetical protein
MSATSSKPRKPVPQPWQTPGRARAPNGDTAASPGTAGFLRRHAELFRILKWVLIAGLVLTMWALAAGVLG